MKIYLIRHGETDGNATRIMQFPETPLSTRGQEQARLLGERMRDVPLVAILTSDYARAHQTAEAVHRTTGAPLLIRERLRERNFGDLRGSRSDLHEFDIYADEYQPPNGENWRTFHDRVRQGWNEVMSFAETASGDFAVVAHALVKRSIVERCVTVPEALLTSPVQFANTSVTIIDTPAWQVATLASADHLPDELRTFPHGLGQ